MSKSILISIKPQFVEKILNKEKTIEIRKTMPKCELPCKVYIYCTRTKNKVGKKIVPPDYLTKPHYFTKKYVVGANYDECINGKVVAEFTLNKIDRCGEAVYDANRDLWEDWNTLGLNNSCVHPYDLEEYSNGYELYAWHIDNLKIYDKPKQLNKLYKQGMKSYFNKLQKEYPNIDYSCYLENYKLQRPPQSWCYVE